MIGEKFWSLRLLQQGVSESSKLYIFVMYSTVFLFKHTSLASFSSVAHHTPNIFNYFSLPLHNFAMFVIFRWLTLILHSWAWPDLQAFKQFVTCMLQTLNNIIYLTWSRQKHLLHCSRSLITPKTEYTPIKSWYYNFTNRESTRDVYSLMHVLYIMVLINI